MRTASCWVIMERVVIISYAQPKHLGVKVNIRFCVLGWLYCLHWKKFK